MNSMLITVYLQLIMQKLQFDATQAEQLKRICGLRADETCKGMLVRLLHPILKELVHRIQQANDFHNTHFQGAVIDEILLCGGGALLKNLDAFIAAETQLPVRYAQPLLNIHNQDVLSKEEALSFCTAIGLALGDFF